MKLTGVAFGQYLRFCNHLPEFTDAEFNTYVASLGKKKKGTAIANVEGQDVFVGRRVHEAPVSPSGLRGTAQVELYSGWDRPIQEHYESNGPTTFQHFVDQAALNQMVISIVDRKNVALRQGGRFAHVKKNQFLHVVDDLNSPEQEPRRVKISHHVIGEPANTEPDHLLLYLDSGKFLGYVAPQDIEKAQGYFPKRKLTAAERRLVEVGILTTGD